MALDNPRRDGGMGAPKVYLAGPDVFLQDPLAAAARKRAICADYGLDGQFPLDNQLDLSGKTPRQMGLTIGAANEAMMDRCDTVIANMTPFHGPSVDVGTGFEIGYMRGAGKPVFAYSNDARTFPERVAEIVYDGEVAPDDTGTMRGADGLALESFDLHENLMFENAIEKSGGALKTAAVPENEKYTDLKAFEQAARACAEHFFGPEVAAEMARKRAATQKQAPAAPKPRVGLTRAV